MIFVLVEAVKSIKIVVEGKLERCGKMIILLEEAKSKIAEFKVSLKEVGASLWHSFIRKEIRRTWKSNART